MDHAVPNVNPFLDSIGVESTAFASSVTSKESVGEDRVGGHGKDKSGEESCTHIEIELEDENRLVRMSEVVVGVKRRKLKQEAR